MTNFVNWPRARPTLDFRISLTIGTSSVAASGMRNNDVTNFVFKGLRYAQPRINTRHSSRPTGSFQSSFRNILTIGVSVANGMRNVSLTSWTILFCTIPHVRAGACTHVRSHFERENLSRVAI